MINIIRTFNSSVLFSAKGQHAHLQLQLQLYLKNSWQYRKKRTGPQIAFANLGGTVTLEDYNENKYTKFTKETYIKACTEVRGSKPRSASNSFINN